MSATRQPPNTHTQPSATNPGPSASFPSITICTWQQGRSSTWGGYQRYGEGYQKATAHRASSSLLSKNHIFSLTNVSSHAHSYGLTFWDFKHHLNTIAVNVRSCSVLEKITFKQSFCGFQKFSFDKKLFQAKLGRWFPEKIHKCFKYNSSTLRAPSGKLSVSLLWRQTSADLWTPRQINPKQTSQRVGTFLQLGWKNFKVLFCSSLHYNTQISRLTLLHPIVITFMVLNVWIMLTLTSSLRLKETYDAFPAAQYQPDFLQTSKKKRKYVEFFSEVELPLLTQQTSPLAWNFSFPALRSRLLLDILKFRGSENLGSLAIIRECAEY